MLVDIVDRVICAKNFSEEEIKQFKDVILMNYYVEFNIGWKYLLWNKIIHLLKADEIDIYDMIGAISSENDRIFLKNKISFNLYYDEDKRVEKYAFINSFSFF